MEGEADEGGQKPHALDQGKGEGAGPIFAQVQELAPLLLDAGEGAAALPSIVDDLSLAVVHDLPSLRAGAPAPVVVFEVHSEVFVQKSYFLQSLLADEEAGAASVVDLTNLGGRCVGVQVGAQERGEGPTEVPPDPGPGLWRGE
jgi:hypothetical protein